MQKLEIPSGSAHSASVELTEPLHSLASDDNSHHNPKGAAVAAVSSKFQRNLSPARLLVQVLQVAGSWCAAAAAAAAGRRSSSGCETRPETRVHTASLPGFCVTAGGLNSSSNEVVCSGFAQQAENVRILQPFFECWVLFAPPDVCVEDRNPERGNPWRCFARVCSDPPVVSGCRTNTTLLRVLEETEKRRSMATIRRRPALPRPGCQPPPWLPPHASL